MENENPWERKKTNPGIDQLLEDLKTMVLGTLEKAHRGQEFLNWVQYKARDFVFNIKWESSRQKPHLTSSPSASRNSLYIYHNHLFCKRD